MKSSELQKLASQYNKEITQKQKKKNADNSKSSEKLQEIKKSYFRERRKYTKTGSGEF